MGRYAFIIRRVLQTIPLLLGVVFLVFLLLKITPGDPGRTILGPRASEAAVRSLDQRLGLNDSVVVQYLHYLGHVVTGNLGTSISQGVPVSTIIMNGLPVTAALLGASAVLALGFALALGILAARKHDRAPDHLVRGITLLGLAMPPFWTGILLLTLVALPTGWFPVSGYGTTFVDHVRSLILPCLTMAIALMPILVRSLRSGMINVRGSDYIAMARSVGIRRRRLSMHYELPNTILPVITLLAVSLGYALFTAVIVENTFGLPGLGQAMLNAVQERDFPVVQGITLIFAVFVVFVHLLADIAYTLIDPRVEMR